MTAKMQMSTRLGWLLSRAIRVVYNAALDLRYGRPLAGGITTRFEHLGAKDTANSDYLALDRIFRGRIEATDVLIDVGCGKGRVINWWLRQGLRNAIIGLELDPQVAEATQARLRRHSNVKIVVGNAIDTLPRDGTLFYMYNPFSAEVVQLFAAALTDLGRVRGGPVRVLYNNCKYLAPFQHGDDWHVELLEEALTAPFDRVAAITHVGPRA